MSLSAERESLFPDAPDYMHAIDGDWSYYVKGHDPDELRVIDDPEDLTWEKTWMRPATEADQESFDDPVSWVECSEIDGAVPYLGCRYKPEVLS